jgi:alpha-galactosidase
MKYIDRKMILMKTFLVLLMVIVLIPESSPQVVYNFNGNNLIIDNGSVKRIINCSNDSVFSDGLFLEGRGKNYLRAGSPEFSFIMNDKSVNGYIGWKIISCEPITDANGGSGAVLKLKGYSIADGMEIELTYLSYPGLPVIRKRITFRNISSSDIKLEAIDVESINLNLDYVSTWVYHNYARMKHLGTYIGNWDDPVVVIHNTTLHSGLALGNESPGVLKRTAFHTTDRNIEIGLTHPGQDFPFRKWLKPGETWESPGTFIALYADNDDGYNVINSVVNDFVRKHLGSRIPSIKSKPLFVYNTWYPFRTFINDSLIREVAKAASECGIQEFIIDDGWQYNFDRKSSDKGWGRNYGDWLVDLNKFPGSLSSTFDYIRSLGMKPGLWISIGSATADSRVFKSHPDWFVINQKGKTGNLHTQSENSDFYTSCFGTEWFSYIKSVILNLVREHGLAYAKLDLSVVTSAYVNDPVVSGCYANDHPYHRDHEESFIVIYQNVLKLFDELHDEAPELFIDCTFETEGKLQLQDYAFVKHAEGNWLSNIEEPFPTGALRMRQLAWWRSPALPAGSLVIGNLPLDSKNFDFDLKSLIGTLPIVLGDPRKLPTEQRAEIKKWADWMVNMQKKYDYMSFRQDLPGFGEPAEGSWDGWARINTDTKKGGIIGVFRQRAKEKSRIVIVSGLNPEKKYCVLLAPEGKLIALLSGQQISEEGFRVNFINDYDGNVFEIKMIE